MKGSLPRSTREPSPASAAGRTVTEPAMATSTTSIVPTPMEVKTLAPVNSMPAIAITTVVPETSTA